MTKNSLLRRSMFLLALVSAFAWGLGSSQAAMSGLVASAGSPVISGYPGQAGNPVGYAVVCPGGLTPFSGTITSGTSGSPTVYTCQDFNAGTGGTSIANITYVDFIGDRFQSNDTGNYNVQISGTSGHLNFSYCSVTPLASLFTSPPGGAWPSAGAGLQTVTQTNANSVPNADGFQYGFDIEQNGGGLSGPISIDHMDEWGFANAINFTTSTQPIAITNSWIHDARNAAGVDHTDGPGYLDGGTPPSNITLTGNTIASIGNTQALAMQGGPPAYNGMVIEGNYLSGFGYNTQLNGPGTTFGGFLTSDFENNVFGTDLPWVFGPLAADFSANWGNGSTNLWRNNTLNIVAGTSSWSGAAPAWTSGEQGYFVLPNQTFSATDWTLGP